MLRPPGDHRGLATVVTIVLAVAGLLCVGAVVIDQQRGPSVPLSAPASPTLRTPGGHSPDPAPAQQPAVGPVLTASAPRSLSIPAIGVRSQVQRLGLAADGTMEVPPPGPLYDEAGWYRHSPTPGALGPAVIVGHVDSAANGPSVFWRLGSLRPRDKVLVTRDDGTVAVFAVDDVRRFRKSRFPTDLVYGDTDHAALRLITCGGPIEADSGHYRDNIVVLASMIRADQGSAPPPAVLREG